MALTGIETVVHGVDDLETSIRYHEDWGLELVDRGTHGADFKLVDNTNLLIRRADDASLPPVKLNWLPHLMGSTVREVIWSVDTKDSLDTIGAELSSDRDLTADDAGVLHTVDIEGNAIGFAVTAGKNLELGLPEINTVGNSGRPDKPAEATIRRKVRPYRFVHVVYWVLNDAQPVIDFYMERLNFQMTDNMTIGGAFLHCDGAVDHHNLFLQCNQEGCYGFQHLAYEVKDLDEVGMLGVHMEEQGWKTNVGPLRHNICSSFSWYLWNPAGGAVEALSDIDHIYEGWEVRTINPRDEGFYGHSWTARPEHRGVRPAQWVPEKDGATL